MNRKINILSAIAVSTLVVSTFAGEMYSSHTNRPNADAAAREPDNTARNVRDRNDQTLTPLDQGNSQADVDATAQIRKEIIAATNMSVNAQNVKIITKDGHVTLRGPVDSAAEKDLVVSIARRAGASVDNQLEVNPTSQSNQND